MKKDRFKEAGIMFMRAKEALPNDTNSLSEGNKTFLKQKLDVF
jgi:hypothetical protein